MVSAFEILKRMSVRVDAADEAVVLAASKPSVAA
jgi:hypothetical protein